MNRITIEKRVQVISALVEGDSLRSVVRMTGVALNTIQKLMADLGTVCAEYQDKAMRNLNWLALWASLEQENPMERKPESGFQYPGWPPPTTHIVSSRP
jgi:hypothetical protein